MLKLLCLHERLSVLNPDCKNIIVTPHDPYHSPSRHFQPHFSVPFPCQPASPCNAETENAFVVSQVRFRDCDVGVLSNHSLRHA